MKCFYRIGQFFMSIATRIMGGKEPHVIKGNDSILQIPAMIKLNGQKRVLLVTTPGFIKRGTLEPLFDSFKDEGIELSIYSEVTPDPTIECVEKAVSIYRDNNCEAIVAVGGGSVLDCSKACGARIVKPNKTIRQMRGILKICKKLPDLYAVPTTAGTGSEATAAAVITDTINGTHYKYAVNDFCLVPKYAVLDPKLLTALPKGITAATGMDALTHAVEAYTNKFASSYVKRNSIEAVKLIYGNLKKAYEDGSDLEARENMLLGSYYAGIAFTNNFVGYVHAVAHAIGGLYGVAHGVANAAILPVVMEQFGKGAYKTLAELADAAGINGANEEEKAKNFIASMRKMNEEMELPAKFEMLKEEDFDEIIFRANKEANPTYPVPVIWGKEGFRELLYKLI